MTEPPTTDGGNRSDGPGRSHRLRYDIDGDESPSEAVVRVVAALTDTSPLELDPLYYAVDPDHLDGIFGRTTDGTVRAESSFTFAFNGCEVTLTHDEVRVRGSDADR